MELMIKKKLNSYLDKKNDALKAVILLGTLKEKVEGKKEEFSHTEVLSELLIKSLDQYNVESEIVRLVDYAIKTGTKSDLGKGDEWPKILKKMLGADIIIFATPIWWGMQSSLIQKVTERMDELNDSLLETGTSELSNKIGGMVITGAEDGVQHVTGNLSSFMVWNGLTLPPASALSYLGDFSKMTNVALLKKFQKQKSTQAMSDTMARNLVFFARLLKENNIPKAESGIRKSIISGAVGLRGDK